MSFAEAAARRAPCLHESFMASSARAGHHLAAPKGKPFGEGREFKVTQSTRQIREITAKKNLIYRDKARQAYGISNT